MFAQALSVTFVTSTVEAVLGGLMLLGWAMTLGVRRVRHLRRAALDVADPVRHSVQLRPG